MANDLASVTDAGFALIAGQLARNIARRATARLEAIDHLTTVRARSSKQATALSAGFLIRNPPGLLPLTDLP